jgi:hypothetical protein
MAISATQGELVLFSITVGLFILGSEVYIVYYLSMGCGLKILSEMNVYVNVTYVTVVLKVNTKNLE